MPELSELVPEGSVLVSEGCWLVPGCWPTTDTSGRTAVLFRAGLRLAIGFSEDCCLGADCVTAAGAVVTAEAAVAPATVGVALAALRIFFHLGGNDVRE